jgi:hypothetical protein
MNWQPSARTCCWSDASRQAAKVAAEITEDGGSADWQPAISATKMR